MKVKVEIITNRFTNPPTVGLAKIDMNKIDRVLDQDDNETVLVKMFDGNYFRMTKGNFNKVYKGGE